MKEQTHPQYRQRSASSFPARDKQLLRVALASILVFWLGVVCWAKDVTIGRAASPVTVAVETEPGPGMIIPDETLAQTRLRILDAQNQPIRGAHVALHLDTPPHPTILNTDFPFVEGTTLLDFAVDAPEGEVQFAAVYPIRGTYTFETHVTLPDGTLVDASPTLSISENPAEIRNFLIMLSLLLGFGLISGLVIGRGRRAMLAVALLGALWLAPTAAFAQPPGPHNHGDSQEDSTSAPAPPVSIAQKEGALHASLTLNPGKGRVGALNTLEVELTNPDGSPANGEINLVVWHLEHEAPIYTFHIPARDGVGRAQVQFFDGAQYELRLDARAQDGRTVALTTTTPIAVDAFSPPLWLSIRVLTILLSVVILGLLIGIWLGARAHLPAGGGKQFQKQPSV